MRKSNSKKKIVAPSAAQYNFPQRHSPQAYEVKKSLSKSNLRVSPSAYSQKLKLKKSPSLDHNTPLALPSTKLVTNNSKKNGIITMSHRANQDNSMARNSKTIVTMSSRNGLKSGTFRIKSGRRRSSALS